MLNFTAKPLRKPTLDPRDKAIEGLRSLIHYPHRKEHGGVLGSRRCMHEDCLDARLCLIDAGVKS